MLAPVYTTHADSVPSPMLWTCACVNVLVTMLHVYAYSAIVAKYSSSSRVNMRRAVTVHTCGLSYAIRLKRLRKRAVRRLTLFRQFKWQRRAIVLLLVTTTALSLSLSLHLPKPRTLLSSKRSRPQWTNNSIRATRSVTCSMN